MDRDGNILQTVIRIYSPRKMHIFLTGFAEDWQVKISVAIHITY